tara:strand:+ start:138 stop:938 length:801 start_codon:yes stop_codon:yes gene_type:complete
MKAKLEIEGLKLEVDFSKGQDISIPLMFNGSQPNTYNVNKATSQAYTDGQFIGDTRKDGPCNFETYRLTPHCNGTHTECIGHITKERVDILSSLKDLMIPSQLISITPVSSKEKYNPELNEGDLLITKEELIKKLNNVPKKLLEGLIIRTLPNNEHKKSQDYMKVKPAFFSIDAMQYIKDIGVKHLLVDTPSVDRLFDDGILSAHNIFWDTTDKEYNPISKNKTITEMIFVDNNIPDGNYLLTIQIPAFVSDAAPSRPIIFNINEL